MKDINSFNHLLNNLTNVLQAKQSIYDFKVEGIDGKTVSLKAYANKVLLIVNVASLCKFTSQYTDLQHLYEKYHQDGFEILAFPCNQFDNQEPHDNLAIQTFCTSNYQISFPLFSKIDVNGANTHPLYRYLKSQTRGFLGSSRIKWNFTKFLINQKGEVVKRYSSIIQPFSIEEDIQQLLQH